MLTVLPGPAKEIPVHEPPLKAEKQREPKVWIPLRARIFPFAVLFAHPSFWRHWLKVSTSCFHPRRPFFISERHVVIPHTHGLCCCHLGLELRLQRLDKADRGSDVIKDQQALFIVEDRVIVREALVVANVVERLQH